MAEEDNNTNLSDQSGDLEDDEILLGDYINEQDRLEADAEAVLGGSDANCCTYPQGCIKRQALYACATCTPEGNAGICLACSYACHEGHNLHELYTKRHFTCDCGNDKFGGNECKLYKGTKGVNADNRYNQNFKGVYCSCARPYPDPEGSVEDEMIQCIVCEDWYHEGHLKATVPDDVHEMICPGCMSKYAFLWAYNISRPVKPSDDPGDDMEEAIDVCSVPDRRNSDSAAQPAEGDGTKNTEPLSEFHTSCAEPCTEDDIMCTEPHTEDKCAEPQTKDDTKGTEPPTKDDTKGTEPHTQDDIKGTKPHTQDDIKGTEPHTQDDIKGTEPHTQDDIKGTKPHTKGDTKGTEPHMKEDTKCAEPQTDAFSSQLVSPGGSRKRPAVDNTGTGLQFPSPKKVKTEEEQQQKETVDKEAEEESDDKNCALKSLQKYVNDFPDSATFWPEGWRSRLCQCEDCLQMYKEKGVDFLIDESDSFFAYEEKGRNSASNISYEDSIATALAGMNRVQQIEIVRGVMDLQTELGEFFNGFAEKGKVVTGPDMREFFERMNQRRKDRMHVPQYTCR